MTIQTINFPSKRIISLILIILIFTACVSIPKETVTLSRTLGNDLKVLQNSHQNLVHLYYGKIRSDIDSFVEQVYAPYIIHHTLKVDQTNFKAGNESLFGSIKIAGEKDGEKETRDAMQLMIEFQDAIRIDIEKERKELMDPIIKEEANIISAINQSYHQTIIANSTITEYLMSIRKIKDTQQQALSLTGVANLDSLITNSLIKVSEEVNSAVKIGKTIDIKSEDASVQLEKVKNQLKKIIDKK